MKDYLVLDIETGGLSPEKASLLQIGVVFVKNGDIVYESEFNIKSDSYKVTPGAMAVNKLDLVKIHATGVTIDDFYETIAEMKGKIFGKDKPTVLGHNVAFDLSFIHYYVGKERWENLFSYRTLDTATIARFLTDAGILTISKTDLDSLAGRFVDMADITSTKRHTALHDAEITYAVYESLVRLAK